MKKRWFLYETAALFAGDQLCKAYVEQNMDQGEEKRLTEHVILRRVHNSGMSFGLLKDMPEVVRVLSITATVIVTAIQMSSIFRRRSFPQSLSLSTLLAGAWSNTFDRLARGYVVDYIGFKRRDKKTGSLTYNLGDFFILAGTATGALFHKRKKAAKNQK